MKTRITALAMVLILALSATAFAVTPRWVSTNTCDPGLSISGTKATCTLSIRAKNTTDKITATISLARVNANGTTTSIQSWSNLTGTGSLSVSKTSTSSTLSASGTYRMSYTVKVTGTGGTDNISDYTEYVK